MEISGCQLSGGPLIIRFVHMEELHMMFSRGEGAEWVRSKLVHDVLSLSIKKTKNLSAYRLNITKQGNKTCSYYMCCLLCIVQSSIQPEQKDWNKYVHVHQQSACLPNLLPWCTCTQLNLTTIAD